MKVQIDKSYALPCSADVAWEFLQNLEVVAGCMPGAKITERLDADRYKGTVAVKVGPASMAFRGEVTQTDVDPRARSLRLIGKGTDSTGSSGASMNLVARIEPVDGVSCNLVGASEVSMSGKAAAFGGRLMNAVADQILKQFADNFAGEVAAIQAQRAAVAAAPPAAAAGAPDVGMAQPAAPQAPVPRVAPAAPAAARELDGLSLAWAVLKDWLRGLFGKKSA